MKVIFFVLFSFFIFIVTSKNTGLAWKDDCCTIFECLDMIKKALPYIFTLQKKNSIDNFSLLLFI